MEPTQHPRFDAAHRDPLTRERIIEAALRIIDGQGLSRLTMRRLGDSLEVEAMAIYHHLPRGKEELLDGIVAYVGIHPADTRRVTPENYRARLSDWARAYRALLLRHAGTLPLLVTRRNPAALATTTASLRPSPPTPCSATCWGMPRWRPGAARSPRPGSRSRRPSTGTPASPSRSTSSCRP
jgi:AcrR family transcriptional regulator